MVAVLWQMAGKLCAGEQGEALSQILISAWNCDLCLDPSKSHIIVQSRGLLLVTHRWQAERGTTGCLASAVRIVWENGSTGEGPQRLNAACSSLPSH